MGNPLLTMKKISKSFSGVTVLDQVGLDIVEGEVHALMGANGAGKSTLMKILTGIYSKDSGEIWMKNDADVLVEVDVSSPKHAQDLGISMVYQELNLLNNISIGENIFLGREPLTRMGTVNWKKIMSDSKKVLEEVNLHIDPSVKVEKLSLAQKQTVEIAKCLSFQSKVIIMDEPTTSLTDRETQVLFQLIENLKAKGVSIVYISHRMEEIFAISDRITVFRDGQYIATMETKEIDKESIIKMMVGRNIKIENHESNITGTDKPIRMKIQDLSSKKLLKHISFELREGEILGFFGLMGAGRTELAKAIFGIDSYQSGTITIEGTKVRIKSPGDAIKRKLAFVPEDRKQEGIIAGLGINKNMILAKLRNLRPVFWRNPIENQIAETYIKELSIACVHPNQVIEELSGGNQQKVIIGKWLALSPKILILDEPTRGIDIGAKTEIYNLMGELAASGMSIMMISSELTEILSVSHRAIIMHEGRITLDAPTKELDQEKIMRAAVGGV